jgi:DNA-binding transcriptional LysR family regulator
MSEFDNKRFDELAAFVAIGRQGSLAAAGRLLQKHPTVISKRLAALEARLGTRLLERTTRQVQLTESGQRFLKKIKIAFETIEGAEAEASQNAVEVTGHLRIAFPGTMGRLWLAPLVPDFLARHPSITLEIDYSDRFVDLVAGGYDAALRVGTLKDSGLIVKKLAPHRRTLVASPAYIADNGAPLSPSDLPDHSCLVLSSFSAHPTWFFTRDGQCERISISGRLTSNDSESLLSAARRGMGIVAAGEWLFANDIREGVLVPVLSDWEFDADGAIYTVRPSVAFPPARTDAFIRWLTDVFADGPPWLSPPRD